MTNTVYLHYGRDMIAMTQTLLDAANVSAKWQPGMRAVIKPNLVVSRSAEGGATTHPEIVEGIVRHLIDHKVTDITIAEGSWVGDSTDRAFKNCGYVALSKKYGLRLLDTKKDRIVRRTSRDFELGLCESIVTADCLINVPVLKGHCQTGMTCCLKNLKGCIPDGEKRRFHTVGLHEPIAALAAAIKPDLHVVDGMCGDPTFEEGGNPVEADRVLLGFDPVLLDSFGAQLLGHRPEDIVHLRMARDFGVGRFVDAATKIREFGQNDRPRTTAAHNSIVKKLAKSIEEDQACSACYAALIFALNKCESESKNLIRDNGRIKIGQGFREKNCKGIGIGNCTSGCESFVPGCPPKAVDIIRFLEKNDER